MGRGLGAWSVVLAAAAVLWLGASEASAGRIVNRCGQSVRGGLWLSLIQQNGVCTGCIIKTAADEEPLPLVRRIPLWTKRDITPESTGVTRLYAFVAGQFEKGVMIDRDQDLEFVASKSGPCILRAAALGAPPSVVQ